MGQLLLNNGSWLDHTGKPFRMLSRTAVAEMWTVQNPGITGEFRMSDQYSLLSYILNQNPNGARAGPACDNSTAGLVIVPGMPNGTLVALGAMGRFLIIIPSEGLVIASFGSHDGRQVPCHGPTTTSWSNRANPILAALWRALGPAVATAVAGALPYPEVGSIERGGDRPDGTAAGFQPPALAIPWPPARKTAKPPAAETAPPAPPAPPGACYCYCPKGQGIGQCTDTVTSKDACKQFGLRPDQGEVRRHCPNITEFLDCQDPQGHCNPDATLAGPGLGMVLDNTSATACPHPAARTSGLTAVRTCTYFPVRFGLCYWLAGEQCKRGAFFPA